MATKKRVNGVLSGGLLSTGQVEQSRRNIGLSPSLVNTLQTQQATTAPPSGFVSAAAPALSGLQAGSGVGAPTDLLEAGIGVGGSTLAGAASGALTGAAIGAAGGPIGAAGGAVIGGGVALLTSGLNAWLSIRKENKRKQEMEKFIKEVEEKQSRRERQARQDSLTAFKFNRQDIERQNAINGFQMKRTLLIDAINSNQNLKDRFIQTGVR